MVRSPDQEIVYRDLRRRTYREFRERIGRLASGLSQIGVDQGDVVAILEWDSDRYHECYFAIPMMGAVMQTVNVSLIPEDVAYTINDTGATIVQMSGLASNVLAASRSSSESFGERRLSVRRAAMG